MKSISEAEALGLVDDIYAAGMSFDLWPRALARLADAFGAVEASLGTEAADGIPWIFAPRTDPEFMRLYAEAYHPLNDAFHAITRQGVGRLATDTMVADRSDLDRSAFHNEWSRPQGYRSKLGGVLLAEQGWRTVLMLTGREEFGRDELRLLELFAPHVKRAVQFNMRLARGRLDSDVTVRLLEQMDAAAFLVDASARVLFANGAAERLFRGQRGLRLAQGALCADRSEDDASLRALIGGGAFGSSGDGVVQLNHASGPPTLLQVMPVRRETPLLAPGLPAAIVLDVSQNAPPDAAQILRLKYGLTAAEAAFALEIAKGDGKRAAAERRGVSFATARTHLSRIFEKTGVHRQAELVRLVLGDTAPTPPG
jgi:DNA-binding CsgD family transcriptional regulator